MVASGVGDWAGADGAGVADDAPAEADDDGAVAAVGDAGTDDAMAKDAAPDPELDGVAEQAPTTSAAASARIDAGIERRMSQIVHPAVESRTPRAVGAPTRPAASRRAPTRRPAGRATPATARRR